jgi:hypothetical protein
MGLPYVEDKFPQDLGSDSETSEFALGIPLRVVDFILEGVRKFTAQV